jgi:hypothetical protein
LALCERKIGYKKTTIQVDIERVFDLKWITGATTVNRNRAADVTVGYANDAIGRGIAYAAIGTGTQSGIVRVPFQATPLALHQGREFGYAAVHAVATELRRRGYSRIRVRVADEDVVRDLAEPRIVPPALAMSYVRARCIINGFPAARVERADRRETADLEARARAELQLRTAA